MDVLFELTEDNTIIVKEALEEACKRGLTKIGLVAEGYAKRLCPVDTGRLRNSITWALSGGKAGISSYKNNSTRARTKANKEKGVAGKKIEVKQYEYSGEMPEESDGSIAVYIGSNVEYAPYVENGARGRKPVHFLKRAAEDHASEYRAILQAELENA